MSYKINKILEEACIEFERMVNKVSKNRSRKIVTTQDVVMKYADKLKYEKNNHLLLVEDQIKDDLQTAEEGTNERKIIQLQKRIIEEALRLRKESKNSLTHPIERNYVEAPIFSASVPKQHTLLKLKNHEGKITENRSGYRKIEYTSETGDYLTPFDFKTFAGLQKLWEIKGRNKNFGFTYPELCRVINANVDGGTYEILRASIIKLSRTTIRIEDYEDKEMSERINTHTHYLIHINQVPNQQNKLLIIRLNDHLHHGLESGNIIHINLLTFQDFKTNISAMLYPLLTSLIKNRRRLDLDKLINNLVLNHMDRRKALKLLREAFDEFLENQMISRAEFIREGRSFRYVEIEYPDQLLTNFNDQGVFESFSFLDTSWL
ncbi:hypothetical protein [Neobacillus drentensis]|uniref:hypothetical protein n=1 Tax=Neobacillus drentensis TaxID=220684 RepID=UPI000824742C|nr:hypothetical protein [Neobacillus drentensis]